MSIRTEYVPGTFCWPELVAADADKAKEFYKALFKWDITDNPIGEDQVYSMAAIGGKAVGGLYQMFAEQVEQGIPSYWGSYVSVANVEETVEKAKSLEANVVVEPMDVFDAGRMAAVVDPTGAIISFWQPLKHIGAEVVNENGALTWNELATNDIEKAKEFYTSLLGWSAQEMKFDELDYTVFKNGDKDAGGMLEIQKEWGDIPPNWAVYFAVDDCDGTVEKAKALGGQVVNPATDWEGVGRIAFLNDSQGAIFAALQPENPPD